MDKPVLFKAHSATGHQELYRSANSIVYRGERQQEDGSYQPVVLKQLNQTFPTSSQLARFKREFSVTQAIQGAGIIKAYEFYRHENSAVMVVEDFGGQSLQQIVAGKGMALADFLPLALKIIDSLSTVHQHKFIHKDINPANIVWNAQTGEVKLIDFGVSTELVQEHSAQKNLSQLEGTIPYMSPEQTGRMNRPVDYRSDFYSLGMTFYELLAGTLPLDSKDPLEWVHWHIAKSATPLHEVKPELYPVVSDIIGKLLEKQAEDRYLSLEGLRYDLELCQQKLASVGVIEHFEVASNDVSASLNISQKLYGRDAELEELLHAFEKMAQGTKSLVSVSGQAGIGKTSLVRELLRPLVIRRGFFVEGKFDQLDRNSPYASLVKAFRSLIKWLLSESDAQLESWREKLLAALGANARLIVDVIPELELVIGKTPEVPELSAAETRNRFINTFQSFVQTFSRQAHPLVIFLDDLQWADLPSLKLLERLMVDPSTRHLLIIVAYRDNEIDATHPLLSLFAGLQEQNIRHAPMRLGPLQLEDVKRFIAAALSSSPAEVASLALLCKEKTAGNPYFLGQFLLSLHRKGLLEFSTQNNRWQWDTAQIVKADMTDNVIDLVLRSLAGLSDEARNLLGLAACIGNDFDLELLTELSDTSLEETAQLVLEQLRAGLFIPTNNAYRWAAHLQWEDLKAVSFIDEANKEMPRYRFSHDRVQQAAYSLLSAEVKESTHYKLGELLERRLLDNNLAETQFEMANHFWLSSKRFNGEAACVRYTQVQLLAGLRARGAAAFGSAFNYFSRGLAKLPENAWQAHYSLTLQLHNQLAEMACMTGDYQIMEETIQSVLTAARPLLDQLPVFEIRILALIAQNKASEALAEGLAILEKLEVPLPAEPEMADVEAMLGETMALLSQDDPESLVNLPEMTDPLKIRTMRILDRILSASYQSSPLHFPVIVFTMIRLSYRHGNAMSSPFAYASYGLVQCGIVGNYDVGYQFGKLALMLVNKLGAEESRAKTWYCHCIFVQHWKEPIENTLKPLREIYQIGLSNGDFEYAAWAGMMVNVHGFFAGQPLSEIEKAGQDYWDIINRRGQKTAHHHFSIFLQTVANLRKPATEPGVLSGAYYQQETSAPELTAAHDYTGLFILHFNRMVLLYLLKDIQGARREGDSAQQYLHGIVSSAYVPVFHFYSALIDLALGAVTDNVKSALDQLKIWSVHAPGNNAHRIDLLLAEKARVEGDRSLDTMQRYQSAINQARDRGIVQDEALGNELLASYLEENTQSELAHSYLSRAYHLYKLWGARAKVDQLQTEAPTLLQEQTRSGLTVSCTSSMKMSGDESALTLDLLSVIKASQAISGEVHLDNVLKKLMTAVMESAGAQIGYLLLSKNGSTASDRHWTIEARADLEEDVSVMLGQSVDFADHTRLPTSILQYVIRTREPVSLSDASNSLQFNSDHYLQHQQPVSVLCVPVVGRGDLVGVIYLENNISKNAFGGKHLETIKLLASQTAISIENALLYANLEERVEQRTQELNEANAKLMTLATTDSLTSAYNRRHFLELAQKEVQRAKRYQRSLTVMMLDIDHFKNINDSYGHGVGDEALVATAEICRQQLRKADIFGRLGGEEFAILAPETPQEEGLQLAERIRHEIEEKTIQAHGETVDITVSIGLSSLLNADTTIEQLLHQADQSLYEAKTNGRNRVEVA